MGLVGLLTGLIYRRIAQYVVRSPLWWAWVPYVLLLCAKPEEDLGTVWTFTFKAAIVMAAVVFAASRSGTGMPDEPVRPTVAP